MLSNGYIPESYQTQAALLQPDEPDDIPDTEYHAGQKRSQDSETFEMHSNKQIRVFEGQMHSAVKRLNFIPNPQDSPAITRKFLNDESIRKLIISQIGSALCNEIQVLCSNKFGSIMKSKAEDVKRYSSNRVVQEMKSGAPALLQLL